MSTHEGSCNTSLTVLPAAKSLMVNGFLNGNDGKLKLKIAVSKDAELPSGAETSMQLNILSPQSKLASKWFLKMQGEITL